VDCDWTLQVVSRPPGTKGWVLIPRRWVVERTFGWTGRCRANSKDYEKLPQSSESMIQISMIQLMLNRLRPAIKYAPLLDFRRFF
jgi:putative transposase